MDESTEDTPTVPLETESTPTVPLETESTPTVPLETESTPTVPIETESTLTVPIETESTPPNMKFSLSAPDPLDSDETEDLHSPSSTFETVTNDIDDLTTRSETAILSVPNW